MRRLRLLAPSPNYTVFARPRLRLNGILGSASGEYTDMLKNCFDNELLLFCTADDFTLVTSDILLRNAVTGIDIAITISVDGIAGEPPETFTITSQPPGVSSASDPLFLFRNTTVTIIDNDSELDFNDLTCQW